MKTRITQREVKRIYPTIIYTGYCSLQSLLKCEDAKYYTARVEGWGADVYDFGSVAIVTGYAPFGNIKADYELTQKYDRLAAEIDDCNYITRKAKLRELIDRFIDEATKED